MNIVDLPVKEDGKDYVPHTKTYTFSSKGRVSRVIGLKTKRLHHLQSDNQYRAFMLFEWMDNVIDIRESYPLLDLKETVDDMEDLNLDKFADKETGKQFVLTTPFLLTVQEANGTISYRARSVKNSTELNRKITLEHLEIERRYWQSKDIEWKIITEKQLNRQYVKNIEWAREVLLDNAMPIEDIDKTSERLKSILYQYQECSLKEILKNFEITYNVPAGTGLYLFRYLVGTKQIHLNMCEKVNINQKVGHILIERG